MNGKRNKNSADVVVDGKVSAMNMKVDDKPGDGERLRALLERHGKKPVDLEKVTGKTRQMINVYMNTKSFTAKHREVIRSGLRKLDIDPGELADDPTALTDPTSFIRLLNNIPYEALDDLRVMLEITDRVSRMGLIALVIDRIQAGPQRKR